MDKFEVKHGQVKIIDSEESDEKLEEEQVEDATELAENQDVQETQDETATQEIQDIPPETTTEQQVQEQSQPSPPSDDKLISELDLIKVLEIDESIHNNMVEIKAITQAINKHILHEPNYDNIQHFYNARLASKKLAEKINDIYEKIQFSSDHYVLKDKLEQKLARMIKKEINSSKENKP